MEENVALDTTKQRKFVKSIKGIKKLIKKNEIENSDGPVSPKPKDVKKKRKRPDRGLVYLSHIPHGFYEHEMTQYFKQFGMVTNVRVIRSKRTGNSKGFAFVEFKEPAVAEIVAETMNNYLMGKRLIKAAYVPPEKQRPKAMRKHWSRMNNPGKNARFQLKKAFNENKDEQGDLKRARRILSNINKTKEKLSKLGISYDFFAPVDVPEALKNLPEEENQVSSDVKENTVKEEENKKTTKKEKKAQNVNIKDAAESLKKNKLKVESQVKPEKTKAVKVEPIKELAVKVEEKKTNKSKKDKKKTEVQEPVVNKKEQNKKQQKLKDAGVKPPENFIRVQEESQDSDSSLEFDSDEYEKMLQDDSDDESDVDEDGDDSVEEGSDENESDEEHIAPPPKKSKGKSTLAMPNKQAKKQKGPVPEQNARKTPQKSQLLPVASKKPKFEKQTQKPMKKQFKKKK